MECNKDEAIRAKELAEKKMSADDFEGARKIALKAQNLYPELDNITQMLRICDVHCSAQKRIGKTEKDWYEILQVGRSADEFAIKKQFKQLALILHPDKNRFPGANSAFQLISEANNVLSDTAKKSIYDDKVRISVTVGPRNPPPQPMNKRAQNNGFSSINQSQTQSSSSVRKEMFWTSCRNCGIRYPYHILFMNTYVPCIKCKMGFKASEASAQGAMTEMFWATCDKCGIRYPFHILFLKYPEALCINCKKTFFYAYEASAQGATVSSNRGHPDAAQSATMGSNRGHPSSAQGAIVGSNQGHPGAHVPSKPDLSKPATFQEKVVPNQVNHRMGVQNAEGSSASHAGSEGIANRKTSIPGPGIQRGSCSESNCAASSFKESDDLKANVTDIQNANSMHAGKKIENSNVVAMNSATVGSNQGHRGVHVPSKPDLSKPATFQEKVVPNQVNRRMVVQNAEGSSASHAGSEGIASRKTSIPGPGIQRGSGSESNCVASSFKESDDLKAHVTDNPNANSMHVGKKSENSNVLAMNIESEDLKHKSWKRGRKLVVESSKSFDSSTNSDLEDVTTKASFGDPAADVNSGPIHSQNQRRSLRKRQHVSYNDNNNHLASPLKKQKASENTKDDGEEQKDAFNGETNFMSNNAADTVEIESDSDVNSNSKDDSDEGKKCDCPELDFDNFKRDPYHFEAGQFWACYDTADGMPRFYAKLKKASPDPFEVSFTWLEAVPIDEALEDWVDEELAVGCGTFKLQKPDRTDAIETFSHQVHCVKGHSLIRGKKRGSLVIHPREGEVWAVFKDWNLGWSLDSENHRKYKYEVVEVLSDFVPGFGIKVCYLDKVKGFKSLFQRSNESETASFVVGPNELYKFSNYVPFYKTTGTEKEGVPVGLFELDTAALPMSPADLYYPNKTKIESENTEPGVHSSLPKSDINEGKSVISESTSTPKKKAENLGDLLED